jgi:hypothetical protein
VKRILVVLLASLLGWTSPAQAKLGEDFNAYKNRIAPAFTPAGQRGNYYMFNMKVEQKEAMASPGYAGGLTVTVTNGKVTGQSLALRPGLEALVGGTLAAIHGMAFAYEAIGKPLPKAKAQGEAEFKAFSTAVGQAFLGQPQNVRYPGFSGLITLSRDNTGNLIVACRNPGAPAAPSTSSSANTQSAAQK